MHLSVASVVLLLAVGGSSNGGRWIYQWRSVVLSVVFSGSISGGRRIYQWRSVDLSVAVDGSISGVPCWCSSCRLKV